MHADVRNALREIVRRILEDRQRVTDDCGRDDRGQHRGARTEVEVSHDAQNVQRFGGMSTSRW